MAGYKVIGELILLVIRKGMSCTSNCWRGFYVLDLNYSSRFHKLKS